LSRPLARSQPRSSQIVLANSLRDKPRQVRRTPLMRSTSPSDRTFPQNRISGSILWLMVSLLCFRNHTLSRAHMVVQLFFQNFTEQCLWEICPKYPSRSILSGVHISVFFRTNAECTPFIQPLTPLFKL